MERNKLYNPRYSVLTREEREALLISLTKYCDERFTFLRFERFERFGMATDTAVYICKGAEFVFVPGGEVTLGWDAFAIGPDDLTLSEIDEFFKEFEFEDPPELEVLLREQMSPVRKVNIAPMLVERYVNDNDVGWRNIALDSPELEPFQKDIEKHFRGTGMFTISSKMRIFKDKETGEIRSQIYEPIAFNDFLKKLHGENFSLPTEDEWEYLCGGGSRTLYRWGDSFDYEMKLHHFEAALPKDAPYTLEEPNQFGLSIAYDPYQMEVVENSEYFLKGGDGGCNICGGSGMVFGYLPVATYFRSESLSISNDELNYQGDIGGGYTFYRRIVRL